VLFAGDLAKALRNHSDLHFGLYHSLFEWFHPLYKEDKANKFQTRKFVEVVFVSVFPVVHVNVFHCVASKAVVRVDECSEPRMSYVIRTCCNQPDPCS